MSELHEIDGIIFGGEKYTVGASGEVPEGLIDPSKITWKAVIMSGSLRDIFPVLPDSIYDYTVKMPDIDGDGNYITTLYRYGSLGNSDREKWKRVILPSHLEEITSNTFRDGQLEFVEFGDHLTSIGYNAFRENQLTSLDLPESLTSIENFVFENNQITSVVIPDSVESIGEWAFLGNPLTEVSIGPNTTYESNSFPSSAVITVRDE